MADGGRSRSEWPTLHRAIGCTACGRTGYKGRFALHEVMLVTEEIERLIIERRSTEDLQKAAVMQGMLTLEDDGLRKVGMGLTSLEEIFRVVAELGRAPGAAASRAPGRFREPAIAPISLRVCSGPIGGSVCARQSGSSLRRGARRPSRALA